MRVLEPGAVLLDALGTLVALEPPAPALCRELAARAGVELSAPEAESALAAEIAYYRAHLNEGRDRETLAALRRRCAEVMRAALPADAHKVELELLESILLSSLRFSAFTDAREAIKEVRRLPARAVVVSNWDVSLEHVLARLSLAPLVDGVVTSAQVGALKPSPAIFKQALVVAGVRPEQAVHVGDSLEEDVEGARRAGIEPILLRRDGRPAPGDVRTISSLSELPAELRRLSFRG